MEEWEMLKVNDVCFVQGGKRLPKGISLSIVPNLHPYIRVTDMGGKYVSKSNIQFVDAKTQKKISKYIINTGDVILSIVGTIGLVSLIDKDLNNANLTENCVKIKTIDDRKLLPEFLYYFLTSPEGQAQIFSKIVGSTQPKLPIYNIKDIDIPKPPLPLQHRIAEILGALDDKIELNRQLNHTLEQMAQALYKHYFVDDIDPENLPEGWKTCKIKELIESSIGGDWGQEKPDEKFCVPVKILRGTDFDNIRNSDFASLPFRYIKQENFRKRRLYPDDIVLEISGGSTDQPTGRSVFLTDLLLKQFSGNIVPASFCRLIRPISKYAYVLQQFLRYLYDSGGTWLYQNQSTGLSNFQYTYFIESAEISIPLNLDPIDRFISEIRSINPQIGNNIVETETLMRIRDSLLPKLISGEIIPSDLQTIEQAL